MAGCSNITSLDPCHVLEAFIFFLIINTSPTIAFMVIKNKKYKNKEKKEKRADCENKKGIAPYQKRETNLKVCKLKCHS